ncbi:hypothetical protein SGPA1_30065 [Streptomyces misionensis JCM 4497]
MLGSRQPYAKGGREATAPHGVRHRRAKIARRGAGGSGTGGQGGPPPVPGDPLPVAADLAGAPAAASAPGGVQIDQRAVVPLALPHGGPRGGVGDQLHGVPGEEGEQRGGPGGRGQFSYEIPTLAAHRAGGGGRGRGQLVDPDEGPPVGRGVPAAGPHQLPDVAAHFPELPEPGGVGVLQRGAGRDDPGPLYPRAQHADGNQLFAGVAGGQKIQTNPSGIEPQRHVPVTA